MTADPATPALVGQGLLALEANTTRSCKQMLEARFG